MNEPVADQVEKRAPSVSDLEVLETLDFPARCEATVGRERARCAQPAAWTFFCVRRCGSGGAICAEHHDFYVDRDPIRSCLGCQVTDFLSRLIVWTPLGGAR